MPLRNYALIVVASIVFALGLVMIFNTTSAEILDQDLDRSTHVAIVKHLLYGALGCLLGGIIGKLGVRRFLRYSPLALALLTFLLALCFVPGIGKAVNGSRRWIALGGLSFQPSEFVKYVIPAYFIFQMTQLKSSEIKFWNLMKIISTVAVPMVLIFLEPNNGTVGVIAMTLVVLCYLTHIPLKYWAAPICAIFMIGAIFAWQMPYVQQRLKVYLDPDLDVRGRGHQPLQAKIAAGSGKLLGKGPGNSLQKLSYLPEAQNDYIAAIYAEEFGFLGVSALLLLYGLMAYLGFSIAYLVTRKDESLLASSAIFLISFQAFLNLGVVSGLLPSTGLNLPFFSQGGTSLIANLMGLSLILTTKVEYEKTSVDQRRGIGWSSFSGAGVS